jgi:nitroreductase/NAD-dependent dihydropyrimidine dehydrogenase PreA subunit
MATISIDKDACTVCEACVESCPGHIFFLDGSEVKTRYEEYCINCGHCLAVCPTDAVIHSDLDPDMFPPIKKEHKISPDPLYGFLRSRRSCRVYKPEPVPKDVLERLIDIGRYAPTAHNWQNVDVIVITDKKKIETLSKMAAQFFKNAYTMIEAQGDDAPPLLREMKHGFRLNFEFSEAGKDRIFRGAPTVILFAGPAGNPTSIDNCLYTLFHMVMMAHALGLGTCINRYFITALDHAPEIVGELDIPAGKKLFACLTVGYPGQTYLKLPQRKKPSVTWM